MKTASKRSPQVSMKTVSKRLLTSQYEHGQLTFTPVSMKTVSKRSPQVSMKTVSKRLLTSQYEDGQ